MHLLKQLLQINENQVFDLILSIVKKHYINQVYYRRNHYIFAKGEKDICLISHTDTLRDERSPIEIIDNNNIIRAEDDILGEDDRTGVSMMLELINEENKPSLLFCNGKERNYTGVRKFIEDFYYFPDKKVSLFIELDRRGENDAVTYNEISKLFLEEYKFYEKFGFRSTSGSKSDIYYLTDFYNIPSVNLSAGFFNEHSSDEYIDLKIYRKIKEKMKSILEKYRTETDITEYINNIIRSNERYDID